MSVSDKLLVLQLCTQGGGPPTRGRVPEDDTGQGKGVLPETEPSTLVWAVWRTGKDHFELR